MWTHLLLHWRFRSRRNHWSPAVHAQRRRKSEMLGKSSESWKTHFLQNGERWMIFVFVASSIIEKGEEKCSDLIEAHKECMRALGFKIWWRILCVCVCVVRITSNSSTSYQITQFSLFGCVIRLLNSCVISSKLNVTVFPFDRGLKHCTQVCIHVWWLQRQSVKYTCKWASAI